MSGADEDLMSGADKAFLSGADEMLMSGGIPCSNQALGSIHAPPAECKCRNSIMLLLVRQLQ